jgi:hypothetical protein
MLAVFREGVRPYKTFGEKKEGRAIGWRWYGMAWSDLLQRMPRKLQLSIAIDGRKSRHVNPLQQNKGREENDGVWESEMEKGLAFLMMGDGCDPARGEKSKNGGRGKKEKKEAKKPNEKGLLLCLGMDGWT